MNVVAMNIGCSIDTLGNVLKQQGLWKIDHVVDVCASRRVVQTAIFGTPTCAIASKLPQLLLLTPMVHITTVYLPKLCAIANFGHVHTNAGLDNVHFSTSRGLPFIEVMAGSEYTVGEMNVMPTVAYLNEIILRVWVLSWSGRALRMAFALISSSSKGIRMPKANRDEIFERHVIKIMPLLLFFQHDNAT